MPVPRHDPLLHRPGTDLTRLEQFLVVVRFDHERMHFAQALNQHLGRITEIGDKPEPAPSRVKRIADGLDCIMRDRKRLHRDVADREIAARAEEPPVAMRA